MDKKHNLSITLFTVAASPLPYEEKLKKIREIGYQSIQGGFQAGMSNAEHKALLDDLGIEMSCFGGGFDADIQRQHPGICCRSTALPEQHDPYRRLDSDAGW